MTVGTRSILFGAHCFFIHPFFVALAWWKLYSFPLDPRLWIAFFVHDLGYIGKPNMDGPEGESHVLLGGQIMGYLFGDDWREFTIAHSRFWAKKNGLKISKLCAADKLATCLVPRWFYLFSVNLTGEINEYMALAGKGKYEGEPSQKSQTGWHHSMTSFMREWAYQNAYSGRQTELDEIKDYLWPNQTGLPNEHRNALLAIKTRERLLKNQIDKNPTL